MAQAAVSERIETEDVQGLVLQGYGRLRGAAYLLLEAQEGADPAGWLAALLPEITVGEERPSAYAVNVALTCDGLARLGLTAATLDGFSPEFGEGMTSAHRSRLLGDQGDAAPDRWAWGGPLGRPVHAALLLYAQDDAALAPLLDRHRDQAASYGLEEVVTLETLDIGRGEHFGFRDGISQPALAGSGRAAESALHTVQPGEVLLGYANEHGQLPRSPHVGDQGLDLGRNGSYLVLRTLSQDVGALWRWAASAAGAEDPVALVSRLVGRWPSGAPLTRSPEADDPALADDNEFGYHAEDPDGLRCPIGAHVRRTNPRDALPPRPGTPASVAVGRRHRLLRRGRSYGTPVRPEEAVAEPDEAADRRGLHFVALCADLARQFEFVSHTWVQNPHVAGLYDDADPLLAGPGSCFTVQADPVRVRHTGLPRFVTVRGGAYFFLPGRRALAHLAGVTRGGLGA